MIGKRIAVACGLLAAMAFAAGTVHSQGQGPRKGSVLTVRVMQAKVMKKPQFIGAAAGTVARGDSLTFVQASGAWYLVSGTANGWLHKTNVVMGSVSLSSKPGGGGNAVSRDEVELAGRGFTPEVENQYRQKNPNLDFRHVDAIEHTSVDPNDLEEFVRTGELEGDTSGGKS